MTNGILVNPDLTSRPVSVDLSDDAGLSELLGGSSCARVPVSFSEDGDELVALVSAAPNAGLAEPNPCASLGKNHRKTGDSAFFTDPTAAVTGPVIIVEKDGDDLADITDAGREQVEEGIRAAENYRSDFPEEFRLWHNAAMNLG